MAVQLTPALEQRLKLLAARGGSSPDELAQIALDRFLTYREDLITAVEQAEESANRDGWLTTEEVMERIEKRFGGA